MPASFESFVLTWLATVGIVKLKASGFKEYESICRRHLVPAFGDVPVEGVTASRIQEFVARQVESGLSPRSVTNEVQVLRRILDHAVTCGLVSENPVSKVTLPRQERVEMRFLTPEQLHQMIEATPSSWRLLTAMAALLGLRKGEQLSLLAFKDIDLEAGVVRITKSMRNGVVTSPKTSASTGVVPLAESLVPLVELRRAHLADDALLFSRRDGSPLPDGLPNRILAKALRDAGLPQVRWHDLRRSWTIAHLQAGTDLRTLQHLGRWKSVDVLISTYSAYLPTVGDGAVRRLDSLVGSRSRR